MQLHSIEKIQKGVGYLSRLQSMLYEGKQPPRLLNLKEMATHKSPQIFAGENAYEVINSKVKLSDIVQTEENKIVISQLVEQYANRDVLTRYGLSCDNKIIFHGPTGCGKTMTAFGLANVLDKKLYLINLATIVNSSLGKTSENIFDAVEEAKASRSIIFFDEFDALARLRSDQNDHGEMKRVTSAIIQIFDMLDQETILIAATNYIESIDPAILRRFNTKVEFTLPTENQLVAYVEKIIKGMSLKISSKITKQLVKQIGLVSYAEARDRFMKSLKRYLINKNNIGQKNIKNIDSGILK